MTCPICKRKFEKTGKQKVVYCPECRKDQGKCNTYRKRLTRPKQRCVECGLPIYGKGRKYCDVCGAPEKEYERKLAKQRSRIRYCKKCGSLIIGQAQYCAECRKHVLKGRTCARMDGQIQKLTLDITLFFTVRCGYTIKHAAAEQQLSPEVLRAYMNTMKDTEQYKRLTEYYREEKKRRQVA
jgi:predicted amidophosphoribosyltransferase